MKEIISNINLLTCTKSDSIRLGIRGESKARCIKFDLSGFVSLYGDGEARIYHKRPTDIEARLVKNVATQDGYLVWEISSYDNMYPGYGKVTITYTTSDGRIAKSVDIPTIITDSQLHNESGSYGDYDCDCDWDEDGAPDQDYGCCCNCGSGPDYDPEQSLISKGELHASLKEVYGDEFIDDAAGNS